MSTRSIVAKPYGDGFQGRYVHFDGYPSGVGASLWDAYHGYFGQNVNMMTSLLVTEAKGGWSVLAGVDWELGPQIPTNSNLEECDLCGRPNWQHYRQYYSGDHNTEGLAPVRADQVQQFDHSFSREAQPTGPIFYPSVSDEWTYSDGDDSGTEWAYVLTQLSLMIFERRFGQPGQDDGHGTGMFGYGASNTEAGGYWAPVASIPWDFDEPDWETLNEGSQQVVS